MREMSGGEQKRLLMKTTRRRFLGTVGAVVGGIALAGCAPAATTPGGTTKRFVGQTLNVHYWSGPEGDNIQKNVTDPFMEETGAKVVVDYGNTSAGVARLVAQKSDPQLDVVMFDEVAIFTLEKEDILTKLNLDKIPNAKQIDPQFIVKDGVGIGFYTSSIGLNYNTDYYKTPPTSWTEMWNPALKGQVGVGPSSTSTLYVMVLAICSMLGIDQHQVDDRVWNKLAELKPNVHSFVDDYAGAAELMKKGEMKLFGFNGDIFSEQRAKGYPISITYDLKEGAYVDPACCVIPKGHKGNQELAELFINKALDAKAQEGMALGFFGPTNMNVKITDPKIASLMLLPNQFSKAMKPDLLYLSDKRPEWAAKYDKALKG